MTEFTEDVITSKRFITGNTEYGGGISFKTAEAGRCISITNTNEQQAFKFLSEFSYFAPKEGSEVLERKTEIHNIMKLDSKERTLLLNSQNLITMGSKNFYTDNPAILLNAADRSITLYQDPLGSIGKADSDPAILLNASDRSITAGGGGVAGTITVNGENDDPKIYISGPKGRIVLFEKESGWNYPMISLDAANASINAGSSAQGGCVNLTYGGQVNLYNKDSKEVVLLDASDANGYIYVKNSTGSSQVTIDGKNGDVTLVNADCAEDFEISEVEQVDPGTVMTIDDDGKLVQGKQPYDKRVAGVVSGAGDLKPGLVLGRKPGNTNRLPIALVGRVNCKVDAHYGSVDVGDLLTTSETPGYAMKVSDHTRSVGAIIGKALCPLKRGRGMIPILVALQ